MRKDIDIVIGGLYGDEGKGRTVDYLTRHYQSSSLVILTNGSAQRGHTVLNGGKKHIFRHFGSGTYNGARSFAPDTFILNPVVFRKEYNELRKDGVTPILYVDWNCHIATPWDSLVNQCCEMARGKDRYGSCGQGVYESMYRAMFGPPLRFADAVCAYSDSGVDRLASALYKIQNEWMPKRIHELIGCDNIPDEMRSILSLDYVPHFMSDLQFMVEKTLHSGMAGVYFDGSFFNSFQHIVCENGQGLAISQRYYGTDNVTPTYTGLGSALDVLRRYSVVGDCDTIAVNYVYKWFITRHGNGPLDWETSKECLSTKIHDGTNVPNEWQGHLRFAPMNINKVKKLLWDDSVSVSQWSKVSKRIRFNVVVNGADMIPDDGLVPIIDENNIQSKVEQKVLYSKILKMVSNEQHNYNEFGGSRILVGFGQDAKDSSTYTQGDLE